jgi:hypothetical protein
MKFLIGIISGIALAGAGVTLASSNPFEHLGRCLGERLALLGRQDCELVDPFEDVMANQLELGCGSTRRSHATRASPSRPRPGRRRHRSKSPPAMSR